MSPNEINVLRIVEARERVSCRKAAAILEISPWYAGYLLTYLSQRGYLAQAQIGGKTGCHCIAKEA